MNGGVTFSLTGVAGPGTYALYTYDAMSGANMLFNSKDGVPDAFEMSGKLADGTTVSGTETVAFVVGDGDPAGVKPGDGSSGGGSSSGSGSGSGSSSSDSDSGSGSGSKSASGSDSASSDGSMASTGAGNPALLGGAAAELGAGFVVATRRRRGRMAGRNAT